MAYRKRKTVRRSKKLGAVLKRDGVFKGSGNYVGMQLGGPLGKAAKTLVPAMLLLVAATALTPPLGNALSNSVRTIPIVGPLAAVSSSYGSQLRGRLGMR
jgi:hypothetical protein